MSASTLLSLAERAEKASGPDRDLDVAIVETYGWRRRGGFWSGEYWERGHERLWFNQFPKLTASLDAAMTLVPEGWETAIYCAQKGATGINANVQMETEEMRHRADFFPIDSIAATPALALCAAALRARAAIADRSGEAGETSTQIEGSTEGESAGPEGIAP